MTAPAGALVKLYVDSRHPLDVGHVVMTQTGRRYLVQTRRLQERGKWVGIRQHLTAIVLADDEPTPEDAPCSRSAGTADERRESPVVISPSS